MDAAGSTNDALAALATTVGFTRNIHTPADKIFCSERQVDFVFADYKPRTEYFETEGTLLARQFCDDIDSLPNSGLLDAPLLIKSGATFETSAIEKILDAPMLKVRTVHIVFAAAKTYVAVAKADFLAAATSYIEKIEELVKRIFIDMSGVKFGYTPAGVAVPIGRVPLAA